MELQPFDSPSGNPNERLRYTYRTLTLPSTFPLQVPIIKLPKEPDGDADPEPGKLLGTPEKPVSLDLNDRQRKRSPSTASTSSRTATAGAGNIGGGAVLDTPKLQRHQKIRDLEGSRTPSPSSVSRKSSFASIFKVDMSR